jgi:hypothetical protein
MLETAGFSKSNPYYIVEQGKVQNRPFCNLLDLLSPACNMHRGRRRKRGASERTACAQVTAITQMTDAQRLALIKDVAGTNVYEEKKGESEKILNDSLRKMDEIKNVRALCTHQCNELASRMASCAYFLSLSNRTLG